MKFVASKYINKFTIAIFVFVIWIVFIDDNSIIFQYQLNKEINKNEATKDYYINEIKKEKQELKDLQNEQKLEKYAREKLLMKKPDEDVYLIDTKTTK